MKFKAVSELSQNKFNIQFIHHLKRKQKDVIIKSIRPVQTGVIVEATNS